MTDHHPTNRMPAGARHLITRGEIEVEAGIATPDPIPPAGGAPGRPGAVSNQSERRGAYRPDVEAVKQAGLEAVEFGMSHAQYFCLFQAIMDRRLTVAHRQVLCAVSLTCDAVGVEGRSLISVQEISEYTGLDRRNVRNALAELARWGYLSRTDLRRDRRSEMALLPAGRESWHALLVEHERRLGCARRAGRAREAADAT